MPGRHSASPLPPRRRHRFSVISTCGRASCTSGARAIPPTHPFTRRAVEAEAWRARRGRRRAQGSRRARRAAGRTGRTSRWELILRPRARSRRRPRRAFRRTASRRARHGERRARAHRGCRRDTPRGFRRSRTCTRGYLPWSARSRFRASRLRSRETRARRRRRGEPKRGVYERSSEPQARILAAFEKCGKGQRDEAFCKAKRKTPSDVALAYFVTGATSHGPPRVRSRGHERSWVRGELRRARKHGARVDARFDNPTLRGGGTKRASA